VVAYDNDANGMMMMMVSVFSRGTV